MKRVFLALLLFAAPLFAQNTNPQQSYAQSVGLRQPNLWLRFNDAALPFTDTAGGLSFDQVANIGLQTTPTSNGAGGWAVFNLQPLPAGNLSSFTLQFCGPPTSGCTLPTAGTLYTILLGTPTTGISGSVRIQIITSFTVAVASTSAKQTFVSGVDYSPVSAVSGQFLGVWEPSSTVGMGAGANIDGVRRAYLSSSTLPTGTPNYTVDTTNSYALNATITGTATFTFRQPGFDASLPNNYSAGIPYNGWLAAPNNSDGDVDWNTPWSMMWIVDAMAFQQAAGSSVPLILMSKGDITNAGGNWWELSMQSSGGPLAVNICMTFNATISVSPHKTNQSVCTDSAYNALTNGMPYMVTFVNNATGWPFDNVIYVNGINGGGLAPSLAQALNNAGNDPVSLSVSGGTGYATTTPLIVSGGGPHCLLAGSMVSSSGVPVNFAISQSSNCTSNPTVTVAGTGTGAVITATASPSTISSVNSYPLMFGAAQGLSTNNAQTPTYVDEFAEFPTAFTQEDVTNLWYWMKWYQNILGPPPAVPPSVLFEDDMESDPDNLAALAEAIGLDLRGYIKLIGVISNDTFGSCQAVARQMLDQAGLNNVPVGVTYTYAAGGTGCHGNTIVPLYNATTDTSSASYTNGTTLFRELFANNPTTAIQVFEGGEMLSLGPFMSSAADGISPLTGLQLMAQNATNGGAVWKQGAFNCNPTSPPNTIPCTGTLGPVGEPTDVGNAYVEVFGNNGTTPIYYIPNTPTDTGPGILTSRTSNDPYYLFTPFVGETRQGWDSVTLANIVTHKFGYSLTAGISGGTGYATYTPLAFTGGGSQCNVPGWLYSPSGVPSSIILQGGGTLPSNYFYGFGYGCTSVPTPGLSGATGTGVTITPYLNNVCTTVAVTYTGGSMTLNASSATCSNHYFLNGAVTSILQSGGSPPDAPWFSYFFNSLALPPPVGQPRTP